jgi:hypothetical protein
MNEIADTFFLLLGFVVISFVFLGGVATLFAFQSETGPQNSLDAKRLDDNLEIIQLLTEYIEANPSQRFGQVLRNTGVIQDINIPKEPHEMPDMYLDRQLLFEEPDIILKRIEKHLAKD